MSKYLICICDDNPAKVNVITAHIKSLQLRFPFLSDPKELKFKDILEENLLQDIKPDLLILDLYDKETEDWAGKTCLELIKASRLNTPTIVFYGDKDGAESYDDFKSEFPFVLEELDKKKHKVSGLLSVLETELLKRLPAQYKLRHPNDLIIQSQVLALGENNLNQICKSIRDKYGIDELLDLERMVSGYSGAFLFKFNYRNTDFILKVSTEISKLLLELENAKQFYHKFPFFNYIDQGVVKTAEDKAVAIIIKMIENGKTLFDFIIEKDDLEVGKVLSIIFLEDYSLRKHYRDNRGASKSWTTIFDKFTGHKFAVIDEVLSELHPIVSISELKTSEIKNFLLHQSFANLDKTKLFRENTSVLCHGDLHSRNILIQAYRPILIDTGGIKYDYWCMDICRLIVDLFIKGLDHNSIDYYDVHRINDQVIIAKSLFLMKPIDLDGKNDNVIKSINWLTEHCSEIYGELYNSLEFQLGLIKEFVQISTRIESVPPNKRAISLVTAYNGMLVANESVGRLKS